MVVMSSKLASALSSVLFWDRLCGLEPRVREVNCVVPAVNMLDEPLQSLDSVPTSSKRKPLYFRFFFPTES